jgi:hypothetical protein
MSYEQNTRKSLALLNMSKFNVPIVIIAIIATYNIETKVINYIKCIFTIGFLVFLVLISKHQSHDLCA